ncbi:MAG: tetratricopeptide repeat protein [Elusimicrobiota bacterium]|nr:MAG: tetratricopeptide repeat protein [Elusimicrobiota bacterium]
MRSYEASFLESLGREAESKAAWSAAADAYGADAKASRLKLARGANLERAYCLAKAGRLDEARALYESLVGAYPDEFSFHQGYARLLFDQKEYPSALISARAAVKNGYGDNYLRAVALEAKILKAMGLKDEAAKSLDAALDEAAAPAPPRSAPTATSPTCESSETSSDRCQVVQLSDSPPVGIGENRTIAQPDTVGFRATGRRRRGRRAGGRRPRRRRRTRGSTWPGGR